MADEYKRMRQLIGTSTQWAADDLVLGDGEIAIERIDATHIQMKMGDGVTAFSDCPYVITPFATSAEVGAGNEDNLAISPLTLWPQTTMVGGVPAAQEKIVRADEHGLIDYSFLNIASTGGVSEAGKIPVLNANGLLPASMLDLSGFQGPGNGWDSDTLDGLDSTAFVRTTTDQSVSGVKTWNAQQSFVAGSTNAGRITSTVNGEAIRLYNGGIVSGVGGTSINVGTYPNTLAAVNLASSQVSLRSSSTGNTLTVSTSAISAGNGSGVNYFQTVAAASGGLQVNNTSTGAGLERVLTTSDIQATGPGSGFDADTLDGLHASAFASAAQGALANTALQPGDNISELVNDANYISSNNMGSGSGINADLLDGYDTTKTAYSTISNQITKVGDYGLGIGPAVSNTDWNLYTVPGFYFISGAATTNQPPLATGYLVQVIAGTGTVTNDRRVQIAYSYSAGNAAFDGVAFLRAFNGTIWSEWRQIGVTDQAISGDVTINDGDLILTSTSGVVAGLSLWDATNTDVDALISGTAGGLLIEGTNNGHLTLGIKSNDANDGLQVISKSAFGANYDKLCFEVKTGGPTINYQQFTIATSTAASLRITGDVGEKIMLTGTDNPHIRFQQQGTNKAFIQWNSSNAALKLKNEADGSCLRIQDSIDFSSDNEATFNALWHAGNLVKTPTAYSTTAGQITKVGDYGLGIGQTVASAAWDALTVPGFYFQSAGLTNGPPANTAFFVHVIAGTVATTNDRVLQIAYGYSGGYLGSIYERNYNGTVWGDWVSSVDRSYRFSPTTVGGTRQYFRLFTIDGISASTGNSINAILSGCGDYGGGYHSDLLLQVTQRGTGNLFTKIYSFNNSNTADPVEIYSVQISDFVFEIWGRFADYNTVHQLNVLNMGVSTGITVNLDSGTGTQPTGAVLREQSEVITANNTSGTKGDLYLNTGTLYVNGNGEVAMGDPVATFETNVGGSGIELTRKNTVGNGSSHTGIVWSNSDSEVAGILTYNVSGATTNTGTDYEMRLSAGNEITFHTGATPAQRMQISNAGNVGIGTDASDVRLRVQTAPNLAGIAVANDGTSPNDEAALINCTQNGTTLGVALRVRSNGVTRAYIKNNGTIQAANGTSAAVGYGFLNNVDTGMYLTTDTELGGTPSLRLTIDGAEVLRGSIITDTLVMTTFESLVNFATNINVNGDINAQNSTVFAARVATLLPRQTYDVDAQIDTTERGKFVYHSSATAHTWTISSALAHIGEVFTMVNDGAGDVTVVSGNGVETFVRAGQGEVPSVVIPQYGMATFLRVDDTRIYVNGVGI